jgi:dTDP-4-amino-4,6-dideoxygalactose transaminase
MTPHPGSDPHSLDADVVAAADAVLAEGHLFRYDSPSPASSPAACFEREFADFLGSRYAVAVNSCSSAIFLSLTSCGVQPGDEVLIPAFTFVAVPSAVVHAGARPVLVESTPDLAVDPDDLEQKITPRTSALLLSYMRGFVPDLERVLAICAAHGVQVIEDVAHGLGVAWDGTRLGRFGRAAAFSFQSHKRLDGGEGGMVVTDDREVALRALVQSGCYDDNWKLHFLDDEDHVWLEANALTLPAYGMRMSNLTAALLRPQLRRIEPQLERFRARYRTVVDALGACPVRLPAQPDRVTAVPDSLQFELTSLGEDQRRHFVERCHAEGVALQVFGLDAANSRCFWNWRFFESQDCPRTRALLGRLADVPLPLWWADEALDRTARTIVDALEAVQAESPGP